jgi:hypothetical protein
MPVHVRAPVKPQASLQTLIPERAISIFYEIVKFIIQFFGLFFQIYDSCAMLNQMRGWSAQRSSRAD